MYSSEYIFQICVKKKNLQMLMVLSSNNFRGLLGWILSQIILTYSSRSGLDCSCHSPRTCKSSCWIAPGNFKQLSDKKMSIGFDWFALTPTRVPHPAFAF